MTNLEKKLESAYKYNIRMLEKDIAALKRHIGKFKDDDCLDFKIAIAERYGKNKTYEAILNSDFNMDLHYTCNLIETIRAAEQEVN